MFQLLLADVIVADREREIAAAIRRRQLLRPQESAAPANPVPRQTPDARRVAARPRPSAG